MHKEFWGRRVQCIAPPTASFCRPRSPSSLPRPSWYTENLGTRHFLEADGFASLPRAVRGCADLLHPRSGIGRARHRHRRRLPLRRRRRRSSDQLSAQSHERLRPGYPLRRRPGAAASGFRAVTSCTTIWNARHAAAGRTGRPRQSAIHRDVEGRAAHHRAAGEVRRGVGGDCFFAVQDRHYKSIPDRMFAIAEALNEEYHDSPTPAAR